MRRLAYGGARKDLAGRRPPGLANLRTVSPGPAAPVRGGVGGSPGPVLLFPGSLPWPYIFGKPQEFQAGEGNLGAERVSRRSLELSDHAPHSWGAGQVWGVVRSQWREKSVPGLEKGWG